jgi:hypothetical protein
MPREQKLIRMACRRNLELVVKIIIIIGHLLDLHEHLLRCKVNPFGTEGGLTVK